MYLMMKFEPYRVEIHLDIDIVQFKSFKLVLSLDRNCVQQENEMFYKEKQLYLNRNLPWRELIYLNF